MLSIIKCKILQQYRVHSVPITRRATKLFPSMRSSTAVRMTARKPDTRIFGHAERVRSFIASRNDVYLAYIVREEMPRLRSKNRGQQFLSDCARFFFFFQRDQVAPIAQARFDGKSMFPRRTYRLLNARIPPFAVDSHCSAVVPRARDDRYEKWNNFCKASRAGTRKSSP